MVLHCLGITCFVNIVQLYPASVDMEYIDKAFWLYLAARGNQGRDISAECFLSPGYVPADQISSAFLTVFGVLPFHSAPL